MVSVDLFSAVFFSIGIVTDALIANIFNGVATVVTVIFAQIFSREKIVLSRWIGVVLCIAGILILTITS